MNSSGQPAADATAATTPAADRKVVLVTGAAGELGRALAAEFAARNWRVAAGYHRHRFPAGHPDVWPLPLNVASPEAVDRAVNEVKARWGRIDVLVNNAGLTADHPLARLPEAAWDQVLRVNLTGAFLCARAVLPLLRARRGGHIVNLSSYSAKVGARGQANYAAAKAALLGFTQSLAKEAGPWNVRVNAVLPGVLMSPLTRSLPPETLAGFAAANALGRLNRPDEVARFIVFLAETENVSGQVFQLDSRIAPW